MAKQITILCDMDGSPDATTHRVSVDDRVLMIDLSEASFAKLERVLAPFFKAGTVTVKASNGEGELQAIRQWALANGHQVSPRGRISQHVMDAYAATHPEPQQS
jgi:hypothetical protein